LIHFQELAVIILNSRNPIFHPTNNDSGIADLGLLGLYLGPDATVNNYDAIAPTIEVWVANITPV
jgi:hypothetical protein